MLSLSFFKVSFFADKRYLIIALKNCFELYFYAFRTKLFFNLVPESRKRNTLWLSLEYLGEEVLIVVASK